MGMVIDDGDEDLVDKSGDDSEPDKPRSDSLVIAVTGYDATRAMEFVAAQVLHQAQVVIRDTVDNAVMTAVQQVTPEVIKERIGAEVDKCLADGWQPTNQWGESVGARVTLRQRIEQELSKKVRQGYNEPELTTVEVLVKAVIEGTLRKEFDAFYQEAKEKFTKALDDKFTSSLNAALKHAFGGR